MLAFLIVASGYCAITNSGVMTFHGGSVWGDFVIEEPGLLVAEKTKIYALTIMGKVDLDECTVHKEVVSFGKLIAKNTIFYFDLTLCSGFTDLDSCTIPNLIISNDDGSDLEVYLKGNCVISGSINFVAGKGKIHKGKNAVILGEVIGGELIEE